MPRLRFAASTPRRMASSQRCGHCGHAGRACCGKDLHRQNLGVGGYANLGNPIGMHQIGGRAAGKNTRHMRAVAHGIIGVRVGVGIVKAERDLAAGKQLRSRNTGQQLLRVERRLFHDGRNRFGSHRCLLGLQGEHGMIQIHAAVNHSYRHSPAGISLEPGGAGIHIEIGIFHGWQHGILFHALGGQLLQAKYRKLLGRRLEHRRNKGILDTLNLLKILEFAVANLTGKAVEQQGIVIRYRKGTNLPLDGRQCLAVAGQQFFRSAERIGVQPRPIEFRLFPPPARRPAQP